MAGHPAHHRPIIMRYQEYMRLDGDQIVEMQALWDIPQLMDAGGRLAHGATAGGGLDVPWPCGWEGDNHRAL